MPKNFSRKTYDNWIRENHHRFKYSPFILESRKRCFTLGFKGLAPGICVTVCNHGHSELHILTRSGEDWDGLIDFSLAERKTYDGRYYCRLCITPEYYSSRKELWEKHTFEPMLEWINKLNEDQWIWLWGSEGKGGWGANMILFSKISTFFTSKCFFEAFSVVAGTEAPDPELLKKMLIPQTNQERINIAADAN